VILSGCARDQCQNSEASLHHKHSPTHVEGEREKVSHGFALKGPYFTVLDRQTHILSHNTTDEGNKKYNAPTRQYPFTQNNNPN